MYNKKNILYAVIIIVLIVIFGIILYISFKKDSDAPEVNVQYPQAIQSLIEKPLFDNEGISTLILNDNYVISYEKLEKKFLISVNNYPIDVVANLAEQDLLEKFDQDQDRLCAETIVLNIPANVNPDLIDYNFGLSFCPDRIHLEDVTYVSEQPNAPVYNPETRTNSNFNIRQ